MFNLFKKLPKLTDDVSLLEIGSKDDFDQVLSNSADNPVFFLKHSTRCPVSDWALTEFKIAADAIGAGARFVWLDLIANREVSDHVASITGVSHESPQLFWIVDGKVLETATHEEVKASRISDWFKTAA